MKLVQEGTIDSFLDRTQSFPISADFGLELIVNIVIDAELHTLSTVLVFAASGQRVGRLLLEVPAQNPRQPHHQHGD